MKPEKEVQSGEISHRLDAPTEDQISEVAETAKTENNSPSVGSKPVSGTAQDAVDEGLGKSTLPNPTHKDAATSEEAELPDNIGKVI